MGLVQFREDDAVLDFLRQAGFNPNQLSRELLEARVRQLRWESKANRFRSAPKDLGDVVGTIRASRDER